MPIIPPVPRPASSVSPSTGRTSQLQSHSAINGTSSPSLPHSKSLDSAYGTQSPYSSSSSSSQTHHRRHPSAKEEEYEKARVTFDKTVSGHYRHGKTGYKRVGVLFLTWEEDDMQCKETEVDSLNKVFADKFNFETDYFQIPSERWQTGLMRKVHDFMWNYDSPDSLAIMYYGGHGYLGKETNEFKFAAKFEADGDGDPTVFFNDIRQAARLPACDQLMIIDCCYAAKAFAREHIGKRKFEILTSAAHDAKCPAPSLPGSFTKTLNDILPRLLENNPHGFSTAHLFRELYHEVPNTKPLLFDQSRHSYGKIWLRPQVETPKPKMDAEGRYLTLKLRLNEEPKGAVMNELASHLQYLPHVDEVRFENLYAPRDQVANFMLFVVQSQRLRPLIRRLHARRQLQKALEIKRNNNGVAPPASSMKLHLEHKHHSVYDWSSATYSKRRHGADSPEDVPHKRRKSSTWSYPSV